MKQPSIASVGWRTWLDTHPSPQGWGSHEFDILADEVPVAIIARLWKRDRRTIEKYLEIRRKEKS